MNQLPVRGAQGEIPKPVHLARPRWILEIWIFKAHFRLAKGRRTSSLVFVVDGRSRYRGPLRKVKPRYDQGSHGELGRVRINSSARKRPSKVCAQPRAAILAPRDLGGGAG